MPGFETVRRVPFTPQQMYALVADVERYPDFLPLCEGLRVTSRDHENCREILIADMDVGYKAFRETFTSRVTLDPRNLLVHAEALAGPFRHLDNRWSFDAVDQGCEVKFTISYEIRSRMLQMLVGGVFDQAFRRFAEAFETRARQVYGEPAPGNLNPA